MKCRICQANIPRNGKFQGDKYKSIAFCSVECYNKYVEEKEKPKETKEDSGLNQLKDYINELWNGQVNWAWMMKQIKSICEEYNLTYKRLRKVLEYAIRFEATSVEPQYGLGQFIKYIEPCEQFIAQIKANMESAKNMEDEAVVVRKPVKQQKFRKEEEWD